MAWLLITLSLYPFWGYTESSRGFPDNSPDLLLSSFLERGQPIYPRICNDRAVLFHLVLLSTICYPSGFLSSGSIPLPSALFGLYHHPHK